VIRLYSVESAIDVLRNLTTVLETEKSMTVASYDASSLKLKYVSFKTRSLIEALKKSAIGKLDLITRTNALLIR
jgi:hypothetical protein